MLTQKDQLWRDQNKSKEERTKIKFLSDWTLMKTFSHVSMLNDFVMKFLCENFCLFLSHSSALRDTLMEKTEREKKLWLNLLLKSEISWWNCFEKEKSFKWVKTHTVKRGVEDKFPCTLAKFYLFVFIYVKKTFFGGWVCMAPMVKQQLRLYRNARKHAKAIKWVKIFRKQSSHLFFAEACFPQKWFVNSKNDDFIKILQILAS